MNNLDNSSSKFNIKSIFANVQVIPRRQYSSDYSTFDFGATHKTALPLQQYKTIDENKSKIITSQQQERMGIPFSSTASQTKKEELPIINEALKDWLIGKKDLKVESFIKENQNVNELDGMNIQHKKRRKVKPFPIFQDFILDNQQDSNALLSSSTAENKENNINNNNQINASQDIQLNKSYQNSSNISQFNKQNVQETNKQRYQPQFTSQEFIKFPNEQIESTQNQIPRRTQRRFLTSQIQSVSSQNLKVNHSSIDLENNESIFEYKKKRRPSIEINMEDKSELKINNNNSTKVHPNSCQDIFHFQGQSSNDQYSKDKQYYVPNEFKPQNLSQEDTNKKKRVIINASLLSNNSSASADKSYENNYLSNSNIFNQTPQMRNSFYKMQNNNNFPLIQQSRSEQRIELPESQCGVRVPIFQQHKQYTKQRSLQNISFNMDNSQNEDTFGGSIQDLDNQTTSKQFLVMEDSFKDFSISTQTRMRTQRLNRRLLSLNNYGPPAVKSESMILEYSPPKSILKMKSLKPLPFSSNLSKVNFSNKKVVQFLL